MKHIPDDDCNELLKLLYSVALINCGKNTKLKYIL